MLVKEANKEKIMMMIKEAEGRSTARTITYEDIICDIDTIERRLGITKKAMVGIKAHVDHNAQKFPNAYKWTPSSTHYTITKKAGGWDISNINRNTTRNKMFYLELPDSAKKAIIESVTYM